MRHVLVDAGLTPGEADPKKPDVIPLFAVRVKTTTGRYQVLLVDKGELDKLTGGK